jgi:hypothetical protein
MELRKFLPDNWQKLDLPSQGATNNSTVGVTLPVGSINLGTQPEPDGQRQAAADMFPNSQQPPVLDPETPKNDAFNLYAVLMEAQNKTATWAPAPDNYTIEFQFDPTDELGPEDIINQIQPFSG